MQITLKLDGKAKKIKSKAKTIEELLKERGVCTESVLVRKNSKFVPAEDKIKEKDEIEIIKITSSG
ncbi:MAG: DUF348 domain-containing protein [archaeon]|nr:MAG: DUF348 domain-containing protein [archaeon]